MRPRPTVLLLAALAAACAPASPSTRRSSIARVGGDALDPVRAHCEAVNDDAPTARGVNRRLARGDLRVSASFEHDLPDLPDRGGPRATVHLVAYVGSREILASGAGRAHTAWVEGATMPYDRAEAAVCGVAALRLAEALVEATGGAPGG